MKTCYVCGSEAQFYHDGVWWCEKHRQYNKEKAEVLRRVIRKRKKQSEANEKIKLGLHWL